MPNDAMTTKKTFSIKFTQSQPDKLKIYEEKKPIGSSTDGTNE